MHPLKLEPMTPPSSLLLQGEEVSFELELTAKIYNLSVISKAEPTWKDQMFNNKKYPENCFSTRI